MLLLALLAIIVPLFLLVVLKLSARLGMSISALVIAATAFIAWKMTPLAIGASAAQATHRALTIGLILFGAVTLLRTLQETGAMERIKLGLHAISSDMRVQTVLVAFAFVSLIEGISGFGTPSIVAAPLLMVLGFRPLAAASLALLGDTVACTFGAVGTPLIVGLENVPIYSANLVAVVGAQVTVFDLVIATLLPLGLVAVLIFSFGGQSVRQKWRALSEIAPWALVIGLVYSLTAFVAVRIFAPEFTSIIAGAVSLVAAALSAKNRWLIPREPWRHHANADTTEKTVSKKIAHIPLWRAWLPYGVVIILLLITRAIPSVKQFMSSAINASWSSIFGIESISSSWAVLYSPGVILLIAALVAALVGRKSLQPLLAGSASSLRTTLTALSALVPTLIMVQIFTNSGVNTSELVAMPVFIGQALAETFGQFWMAIAPALGAIGAFIAGSSTVSTLTMAPIQYGIALDAQLPFVSVLALQMSGAAAGNTIAIHNVVAASVVVGLTHREGLIIRKLIVPTLLYILLAAVIGLAVLQLSA